MSILTTRKTTEAYLERISAVMPQKSWESVRRAIRNFIRFCGERYGTNPDKICQELLEIKKSKDDEYQDAIQSRYKLTDKGTRLVQLLISIQKLV